MQTRAILQTLGTVSSLILAFISLKITHNLLEIDVLNLTDLLSNYTQFVLPFATVILMTLTGFSYFKTREEHEGGTRFLYLMVAVAHVVIAPIALVIGSLRIEFGQYWWAVLIGILLLIYWGTQQKESQN
jgi:ABC-type multidrug transport system permease subunit